MDDIFKSFIEAGRLIICFDREIFGIIGLTLAVTIVSTFLAAIAAIPCGLLLGSANFAGRKIVVRSMHTLMGLPPVVAGLLVSILLSSKGPLGTLKLLFTPLAMVIAQVVIVFPIITALTEASVWLKSRVVRETCKGLGIGRRRSLSILLFECRYPILSALLAGYGRAISEVGAVMLVGGNIQYHTRVMTTAIVLETGKGNYAIALALGMILLVIAFIVNWIVQGFQEGKA